MPSRSKQNGVHLEKDKRDLDEKINIKSPILGKQEGSTATAILSFFAVILAVVCAVFRSSILHHGQMLWISSGDFVARMWGSFYDYFDGNVAKMGLALHCLSVVQYWLIGGLFLIIDLTGRPKFIIKYKVQLEETEIPTDKLRRTLWMVFLNHTLYSLPILVGLYYAAMWRGCGFTVDDLPNFPTAVFHFVVFAVVEEIGFYYSHRLLHHPALYKSIHKMHHEWTAPIGMVTTYAHPFENFISNCLPSITSALLLGTHLLSFNLWILLAQYTSIVHHSGYHIPLLPSPEFHDYHHLKFNNNYGVLGFLDWLHGTDVNYKKSKQFLRHKTLYSLTPMNDLIPDDPK